MPGAKSESGALASGPRLEIFQRSSRPRQRLSAEKYGER